MVKFSKISLKLDLERFLSQNYFLSLWLYWKCWPSEREEDFHRESWKCSGKAPKIAKSFPQIFFFSRNVFLQWRWRFFVQFHYHTKETAKYILHKATFLSVRLIFLFLSWSYILVWTKDFNKRFWHSYSCIGSERAFFKFHSPLLVDSHTLK